MESNWGSLESFSRLSSRWSLRKSRTLFSCIRPLSNSSGIFILFSDLASRRDYFPSCRRWELASAFLFISTSFTLHDFTSTFLSLPLHSRGHISRHLQPTSVSLLSVNCYVIFSFVFHVFLSLTEGSNTWLLTRVST